MENKNMKKCQICGNEIAKNAKVCPSCGAKNKKPFYKKAWFIICALVVVIAVAANSGKDTNEQPANTETKQQAETTSAQQSEQKTEEVIQYTSYDVSELMNDMESNALKAETKYNKQYLELTGRLGTIDSDGKYISLMPSDNEFAIIGVHCNIKNDEQKAKVAELSAGDIITVKGKIVSIGEVMGYTLDIDSIN